MNRTDMSIATLVVAIALLLIPAIAVAQNGASTAVHAGIAYSTHVEDIGVMAGGYFPIMEKIKVGGEFTYYFTDDAGATNFTLWTLDLNGRYAILDGGADGPSIDVLAGLNILRWKGEYDFSFVAKGQGGFDGSISATDVGLNAGGIVEYPLGGVSLFGKAHAVIGGDSSGIVVGSSVSKSF
jgi:hypothetical protein